MQTKAVIDLGSNTFHILIVEVGDSSLVTVFRKRVFVGLSDGGILKIKPEKIIKGQNTLSEFRGILDEHKCKEIRVIGTAVLRKAENRVEFIEKAEEILGAKIEIIDGDAEADFIFKGIMLLPGLNNGTHLIMDIGGGSTEFILVENGNKIWAESYTLGVGVLHHLFHKTEPMSLDDIEEMAAHVIKITKKMWSILSEYKFDSLIGASGSFEVLQSMTEKSNDDISEITMIEFLQVYYSITRSNYEERLNLRGLPPERAKLIVVGVVLLKIVTDLIKPKKIIVSPYALKEGVLSEMIHI